MNARDCAKEVVTIMEMEAGILVCSNRDIGILEFWFGTAKLAGWVPNTRDLELLALGGVGCRKLLERIMGFTWFDIKLQSIYNNPWGDSAPNPAETWRQEP